MHPQPWIARRLWFLGAMDTEDAGPSDAGSVSGYSELGSISSQLPTSDTLGYAAMMLAEAELRLEGATRQEQETDAMLLLARREHGELKELNATLRAARDVLRKKIVAKRRGKAQELAVGAHFSEAYDWVCEITKLTAVSAAACHASPGGAPCAAREPRPAVGWLPGALAVARPLWSARCKREA